MTISYGNAYGRAVDYVAFDFGKPGVTNETITINKGGEPKVKTTIKVTSTKRRNLARLAAYLEYLPEDYKHFEMESYFMDNTEGDLYVAELAYVKKPDLVFHCGSAACALGHAPAAGIKVPRKFMTEDYGIDWDRYGMAKFADDGDLFTFLFGGHWSYTDNHHWGAAARIRYYLAGEDIEKADERPKEYAAYRVTKCGPLPAGALPFVEMCCKVPA